MSRRRSVELHMPALAEVLCTHASQTFTLYGKRPGSSKDLCETAVSKCETLICVCAASEPTKKVCRVSKKELRYLSKRLRAVRLADLHVHVPVTWFLQPSSEGGREVVCSLPSGRFRVAPVLPSTFAPCEAGLHVYAPSMASSQFTSSATCTCSLNNRDLSWLRTAYVYRPQSVNIISSHLRGTAKVFHIRYDRDL